MKLNKLLRKHIKNENFVKVYTSSKDFNLGSYEGFIFDYSDDYVLMNDMRDFDYDGLVVFKKSDIYMKSNIQKMKNSFCTYLKKNISKKRYSNEKVS